MATEGDSRTQIVQAVWAVIAAEGIEGVSMRSVARAAGVSVGRIQHHFGSRADLVRASARAMIDGAAEHQGVADPAVVSGVSSAASPAGAPAASTTGSSDGVTRRVRGAGESARVAVAHVVPTTPQQRVGTTIWLAYLAASVADAQLADILADAKRGQEDVTTQLLQAETGRSDEVCRARARRLIALADGLASRVLIGDLSAASALALIDEAWDDWGAGVETSP